MPKIRIRRGRFRSSTSQSSIQNARGMRSPSTYTYDVKMAWAKVIEVVGRNHVDVELDSGQLIRHVPCMSEYWVTDQGDFITGGKNVAPVGAKVLVLMMGGIPENSIIIGAAFDEYNEDQKEILVDGEESTTEVSVDLTGWKTTYDRETGNRTIESPSSDSNQIVISVDRDNEEVSVGVGSMLWMVTPDRVEIGGASKDVVTHAELNTALQNFITSLNTHTHPTPSGPSSAPTAPMSLDISSAKADKMKVE